jgi:hypothetical protein
VEAKQPDAGTEAAADIGFRQYLKAFENRVVIPGIIEGCFGKIEQVHVGPGKLARLPFGKRMGGYIRTNEVLVIDYYGYAKKSAGFAAKIMDMKKKYSGKQIKMVRAPVVYFASIRLEKVAKLAPDLVASFSWFKKQILDARGFKHNYDG